MERMDFLVNGFMQQHNLTVDDLLNYLVERKAKEQTIPLNKANFEQIKVGMYWYDDNTISETYYSDRRLKSLILAVYEDHVIGDTFFQKSRLLDFNSAMCEIASFKNDYIPCGKAHRAKLKDLESVANNIDVINKALKAIGKPQWRFSYWTDSINPYEDDWYRKKWHYIVTVTERHRCRPAPDREIADARPLLYFELK